MNPPPLVKLRDCVKLAKGKPPAQQPYYGAGSAWYLTPEYLRGAASCESAKPSANAVHVQDGETILLWDGSNAGEVFLGRDGMLASTMTLVSPDNRFTPDYFFFALKQWEPYLKGQTSGSGIPHVDKEVLGKLEITEFAEPEQFKIAEVLSTVDSVIAQTEGLIAKQQRIKTGLMQDLLTRGIDEHGQLRSEATHVMVPLSELAEVNPPRQRVSISGAAPVSFIPMSDVSESGRWTTRQARPYSQVVNGYTRFLDGDVLFAKITPCMENGKGCHAIGLVNGLGFASTEFHVLRAKDDSDARFIFQWTLDRNFRQKAAAKMTGSAGQQRVPTSFFDSFLVPHFKKSEQAKIAEVLTRADEMIEQGRSELTKLHHLKAALMQDLLTGRVRVTPLLQPAEEAASA